MKRPVAWWALSLLALVGLAVVAGLAWAVLRGESRLFGLALTRVVKLIWDGRILVVAYLPALIGFGWLCSAVPGLDRTTFRACLSAAVLALPVFVVIAVEGEEHRRGLLFFAFATYIGAWLCLVVPRLVIPEIKPGRFAHPVSNLSL